jgi:hypothetical protein
MTGPPRRTPPNKRVKPTLVPRAAYTQRSAPKALRKTPPPLAEAREPSHIPCRVPYSQEPSLHSFVWYY